MFVGDILLYTHVPDKGGYNKKEKECQYDFWHSLFVSYKCDIYQMIYCVLIDSFDMTRRIVSANMSAMLNCLTLSHFFE